MEINLGEREGLARALTLVESTRREDRLRALQLLEDSTAGSTGMRVGVSGSPGVGKSTFIEMLGLHLLKKRRKLAVLAVDPSSPVRGGSLLGDKMRMEKLSSRKNVFIRPSPSAGMLGGVARRTRESILLCEAAGYDHVLVETVGVGQSEYEVAKMVDFFLLLIQPGSGDAVQAIKRGVLELADAVVVNKADGPMLEMARLAQRDYRDAVQMNASGEDAIATPVFLCSATEGTGIDEIWDAVSACIQRKKKDGKLLRERALQGRDWFDSLLVEMLEQRLAEHPDTAERRTLLAERIARGEISPYRAAEQLLSFFLLTAHSR